MDLLFQGWALAGCVLCGPQAGLKYVRRQNYWRNSPDYGLRAIAILGVLFYHIDHSLIERKREAAAVLAPPLSLLDICSR